MFIMNRAEVIEKSKVAQQGRQNAHAELVKHLSENETGSNRLVMLSNNLMESSGYEDIMGAVAEHAADSKVTDEDFLKYVRHLMDYQLRMGADDTWSGRGNDGLRSFADGQRKALSDLLGLFPR